MPVVGTAGHVDHGKSALVRALTGVDPDRLAEEKRRGMTIDLGFGHLALPGVGDVGIVDVPGHARFLPNMLAGVHGLDAVLLVVAADEGLMPQTREHLDIVGLVGVDRLVVALTKVDLVPDETELRLAEAAVTEELSRRALSATIVRVAALQGQGLDAIRAVLARVLSAGAGIEDTRQQTPRLPVDRVFVLAGFGPVVTGTLIGGDLLTGQEVELVPSGRSGGGQPQPARIRGLHQHGHPVEQAAAGSRVAVNLQGIDRDQLARGQVLSPPGLLRATDRVAMTVRVLAGADRGVAHNARVTTFSGTSSSPGRVRVIDDARSEVAPGSQGMVEIRLAAPMAILEGDAVVLRRPAPAGTIAGGRVADVRPPRFVRSRGHWETVAAPESKRGEHLEEVIVSAVRAFHARHPGRAGVPRAEIRPVEGIKPRRLAEVISSMVASGALVAHGDSVGLPAYEPRLTAGQVAAVERVMARLGQRPMSPPRTVELVADGMDRETRHYLEEQHLVVRVAPDLLMLPAAIAEAEARLRGHILAHGSATVADTRDLLDSSRKTVVPLLEYFDAINVTRRDGDVRLLAG